jgi:hypothetical protein
MWRARGGEKRREETGRDGKPRTLRDARGYFIHTHCVMYSTIHQLTAARLARIQNKSFQTM